MAGFVTAAAFSMPRVFARGVSVLAVGKDSSFVESSVKENDVMIFSKSYCPYCTKAKQAFDSMGVDYGVVELDQVNGGAELQAALLDMTGQRTVPNVWVKGKHLGGCDDTLSAVSSGKLKELLK